MGICNYIFAQNIKVVSQHSEAARWLLTVVEELLGSFSYVKEAVTHCKTFHYKKKFCI